MKGRVVHTAPILSRERWELLPRPVARERLGLAPEARCVFVSAGGGGDPGAERQLEAIVAALAGDPRLSLVAGPGPLYRGRPLANMTCLPGRAAEWSLAFDAAVCAAGYNTFGELMFAGVPVAFWPQDKHADDQLARAKRAVDRGAGVLVSEKDVYAGVLELLDRPGARDAARAVVPENGGRVAAAELLRLVCAAADVDRVEAALVDEVMEHAPRDLELEVLGLAPRLARGGDDPLATAVRAAPSLLEGRDPREVRGLVDAVVRGLPSAAVAVRAEVCLAAMAALEALEPGDGAAARGVVAAGRWGGSGPADGRSLARAMRA